VNAIVECACGCGQAVPPIVGKGQHKFYASPSCRKRAQRSRDKAVTSVQDSDIVSHEATNREVRAVLKYPGSKWRLASWIISYFPSHKHYVEPYCGSASCFFTKAPSEHEVLNDLNGHIVNFFTVLRTRGEELAREIMLSPFSEAEYNRIERNLSDGDELEQARRFVVRSWQAHGGTIYQVSGWKHNGLRGNVYPTRLWQKIPERLMIAAERLQNAEIRCKPALEIIDYYNTSDCLLYVDPPYVLSTRGRKYYSDEMTDGDHADLLEALDRHTGPVVLSGYAHPLYDDRLKHWQRVEIASQCEHGKQQVEVLWMNAKVPVTVQQVLF
jgi:DNA adenine methylase